MTAPVISAGDLVERLRSAVSLGTSMGVRGKHPSNIYNLADEAAARILELEAALTKIDAIRNSQQDS